MKPERISLLLSILGITVILILSNFTKPALTGEINNIKITKASINIELKDRNEEIFIINKTKLQENIFIGNYIEIYGDLQKEINKTIIFADRIICLDCE